MQHQTTFVQMYAQLVNTARKVTRNQEQAEDIVQNLYIKMCESDSVIESIRPYLSRAARFSGLNHVRDTKSKHEVSEEALYNVEGPRAWLELPFRESFLHALPGPQQRLIRVMLATDCTLGEYALENNMPYMTVKSQYRAALSTLRLLYKV